MPGMHMPGERSSDSESGPMTGGPSLTLAELEAIALANNPTLVQARAKIAASQGEAWQAGLLPNPNVGYASDQIGAEGTAGELQGAFIEQEFVTGGKLRLSRAKYQQRTAQAELIASCQEHKVINGVRIHYYRVLAAKRRLELERNMGGTSDDFQLTSEEMANMGQKTQPEVLESRILARRQKIAIREAENQFRASWQALSSQVGLRDLPPARLSGNLELNSARLVESELLEDLLANSPEILTAWAEVRHDQISVRRERVQPIPNVFVGARSGYNFETNNTTAAVQVGINLPVFDRNQGTVRQAQADLSRSIAEVKRIELSLRKRFAETYARYDTACCAVQDYREVILPLAREALELSEESYRKQRSPWMDVLRLKRNHADLEIEFTQSLLDLRQSEVELQGMLLVDGLEEPPSPTPGGHMDATPKPR